MRLPLLSACFIAGTVAGTTLGVSTAAAACLLMAAAAAVGSAATLRWRLLPILAVVVAVLGAWWGSAAEAGAHQDLTRYHGAPGVHLEGVILHDPEPAGEASQVRLSVDRVRWDREDSPWLRVDVLILVTARHNIDMVEVRDRPFFRYGDRLACSGELGPPADLAEFDYAAYLASQGIETVMAFPVVELVNDDEGAPFYHWLFRARSRMAQVLESSVHEPQAAFGQAVLLGIRDNLPESLTNSFQDSGTTHMLAISGLHVGVLLGISLAVSAAVFGRRYQAYLIVPMLTVWSYTLIAGASPSAVRAAIMGTAYLGALAMGRPRSTFPALALAAAVMVAAEPGILTSISFQLSFAAMTGISVFSEPASLMVQRGLGVTQEKDGFYATMCRLAADSVAVTCVATFATMPLIGHYFQQVSLVGLPSTTLAMLALPLALLSHAATALTGLVSESLAQPFGWMAWATSAYISNVASLASRFPWAVWDTGAVGYPWVAAFYGLMAALVLLRTPGRPVGSTISRFRGVDMVGSSLARGVPWQGVLAALAIAGLAWTAALSQPEGTLKVVFADVGQGDMAVITTPNGHRIVIDGGPDRVQAARVLGGELRFWERQIDLVVLTHPHSDHIAGLTEVLHRYDVQRVLHRPVDYESAQHTEYLEAVSDEDAEEHSAEPGLLVAFDDSVVIEVMGPPRTLLSNTMSDIDNASVALRVEYGSVSFMFSGDTFAEGEGLMARERSLLDSDVLKVSHHGSRSSSGDRFLSAVSPEVAVISAGLDNQFGHPHRETLDRLARHVPPSQVYVTKDHGNIEVVTDGRTIEVSSER